MMKEEIETGGRRPESGRMEWGIIPAAEFAFKNGELHKILAAAAPGQVLDDNRLDRARAILSDRSFLRSAILRRGPQNESQLALKHGLDELIKGARGAEAAILSLPPDDAARLVKQELGLPEQIIAEYSDIAYHERQAEAMRHFFREEWAESLSEPVYLRLRHNCATFVKEAGIDLALGEKEEFGRDELSISINRSIISRLEGRDDPESSNVLAKARAALDFHKSNLTPRERAESLLKRAAELKSAGNAEEWRLRAEAAKLFTEHARLQGMSGDRDSQIETMEGAVKLAVTARSEAKARELAVPWIVASEALVKLNYDRMALERKAGQGGLSIKFRESMKAARRFAQENLELRKLYQYKTGSADEIEKILKKVS